MAITRIKNNQITDGTIDAGTKCIDNSVTAGKLEDNLVYASDLSIAGDLTVTGTTTTINTTNTTVEDPLLVLGSLQAGAAALDIGIIGERGTDTNVAFVWDESNDEFVACYTTTADSSSTIVVDAFANIHANDLIAEGSTTMANLHLTGTLQVDQASTLTGAVDMGAGLDVTGTTTLDDVSASGTLGVVGTSTLGAVNAAATTTTTLASTNIDASGTLDVVGTSTLADVGADAITAVSVGTSGAVTVGTTLAVGGTSTLTGALVAQGGTTTTTLTASGLADLNGNLDVLGTSNFTGDMTAVNVDSTTMDVAGAATVGTTLDVTGNVVMGANLTLEGGSGELLTVKDGPAGNTTFSIDSVTGNTQMDGTLTADGAVTMASTLDVTGVSTLGVLNAQASTLNSLTVTTDAQVGGTLGVTGVTTIASLLNADGGIAVNTTAFTVDAVTGNVATTGTLGVTGASNFTGVMTAVNIDAATLDTNGNVTIGGTSVTTGTADFNSAVTMGDLTIDATSAIDMGANAVTNIADPADPQDAVSLAYLDANVNSIGWTLVDDAAGSQVIQIGDTLHLNGTANEVNVAVTAVDIMTIGLPDDVTIANNLTVTAAASAASASVTGLTATGTLTSSGLSTLDSLTVSNAATMSSTLGVAGNTTLTGTLVANNTSDFNGAVTMGALTFDGGSAIDAGANKITNLADPTLAQDAATQAYVLAAGTAGWTLTDGATPTTIATGTAGGTLTVSGTANEVDVVTGAETLTIGLPDNVTVAGTLTSTGVFTASSTSTLTGAVTASSTLDVVGLASLDGGIDVDGVFTVSGAGTGNVATTGTLAAGNTTVTGTLTATGLSTLDGGITADSGAFTVADTTGNINTTGTLGVDGAATFNDSVTLTGGGSDTFLIQDGASGTTFSVASATGNTVVAGTLDTAGLASLDGGIDVDGVFTVADATGNTAVGGTLVVTGTSDLNGDVTIANTTWDASSTIDAGGNKIINMADPTASKDGATKSYVDQLVSAGTVWRDPVRDPDLVGVSATEPGSPTVGTTWIATAGGTWTGSITVTAGDALAWNGTTWILIQNVTAGDRFIIAGEHGTIDTSLYSVGFRDHDLVQYVSGAFGTFASWTTPSDAGYSVIHFSVPKATTDATGFANDATVYVLDVLDASATLAQVQVTGSAAQTIATLITEINTDLDTAFGAGNMVASLEHIGGIGHIHITDVLTSTRVTINAGTAAGTDMLATLTDFSQVLAANDNGTTVIASDPESPHYGHTYMYSHDDSRWIEIAGPGSIEAGDNLAFTGNILNVSPQGTGSALDADQLDGQEGTWYQDWTNTTNKPSPTITVDGDGSGSVTLTELANGTLTLTVLDDSHDHIIANVDGLQTNLDSRLLDTGDTMAGAYTVTAGGSISWATAPTLDEHLANKGYVDQEVEAGWTVSDGTNTSVIVGGSAGDTLTVNGTANEVETLVAGDTLTIGLPDNVTVTGVLTSTGGADFNSAVTMGDLTIDAASTVSMGSNRITNVADPVNPQDAMTLAYITDNILTNGWTFSDGTNSGTITPSDTLLYSGTAGEIEVVASTTPDTVTFGLPDNVSITGTLGTGGLATLESLSVTNGAAVGGTLGVTGNTTVTTMTSSGLITADSIASGNVDITGTLTATGVTTLDSLLNANGGIAVDGTAFTVADTTGNIATTGTLTVAGVSGFTGLVTAVDIDSATLDTTGAVTIGDTLDVTGDTTVESNLTMNGGAAQQFVITDGAGTPVTTFSVDSQTGNTVIAGSLGVTGLTTLVNVAATNIDTVTMDATGNATVGGTFAVTDTSSFTGVMTAVDIDSATLDTTGAVTVGTTLDVTGDTSLSTLDTSGLAILESLQVTNDATFGGTIGITGELTVASAIVEDLTNDRITLAGIGGALEDDANLTFNGTQLAIGLTNFTVQQASGNTLIAGTLGVTGQTSMSSAAVADLTSGRVVLAGTSGELEDSANLTFNGTTLGVIGGATISTSATVGTTLGVTGATTLGSTLGVTGATTLSSTLGVTGTSTLATTGVTGVLTVTGSAAIDGITIDGNAIDANSGTEIVINEAGADINFRVEGDTDTNLIVVDAGTDSVNIGTATAVTDVQFQVAGTSSTILTKGTTAERPAVGVAGMLRYNTTNDNYEYFDGDTSLWADFGVEFTVIASETFNGDDVTTGFTLASSQTTASCIISINGVVQHPVTAYGVTGTSLVFTQAPATGDVIEVREITTTTTLVGLNNGDSTATVEALVGQAVVEVKGDLNPITDVTYDLGSPTKQWKDLHLSGTTIYLGGSLIKNDAGTIKFLESDGITAAPIEAALDPDIDIIGGTY